MYKRQGYYGGYYGGYYYSRYQSDAGGRTGRRKADSGAKGALLGTESQSIDLTLPEKSSGRTAAEFIARVMAALVAFVVVLAVAAVVMYFADRLFEWGLISAIMSLLGLG